MAVSLVGKKCGMTRVFTPDGAAHAVTVLEVPVNRVVKLIDSGYRAIQVTAFPKQTKNMSKAEQGHFSAANVAAGEVLQEIRLTSEELPEVKQGDELSVDLFAEGEKVDVTGVTKGCGFAGGVKRHGFSMQDATHGNSLSHRAPGSIGQCQTPGRVFKGKKMAGQMGNVRRTIQSQRIIRVDAERGLILVKGGVPGAPGGLVTIKKAVKARNIEG